MAAERERDKVEKELFSILMENARNGSERAIDLLGRMKNLDLFARPGPAKEDNPITKKEALLIAQSWQLVFGDTIHIAREDAEKLLKFCKFAASAADPPSEISSLPEVLERLRAAIEETHGRAKSAVRGKIPA